VLLVVLAVLIWLCGADAQATRHLLLCLLLYDIALALLLLLLMLRQLVWMQGDDLSC
jgi:hypothetical protein